MKTDQTLAAFALANQDRKKSLLQYVSEGANNADLEAAGYTPAEVAAAFPPTKPVVTSKEFDRDRQAGANPDTLQEVKPSFWESVSKGIFSRPTIDGVDYDPKALPIGAFPETDQIVGKDELGLTVRKTSKGKRYTVSPVVQQEIGLDQKAANAKKNLGAAYEAVTTNPLGVAKDVGLGIAKSALNTASVFTNPNATVGDAIDAATMVSLPSAPGLFNKFDPNVLRMFAGPEAKNFPHLMEAEASVRLKAGEDPQKIWEDTGIQFLPDGRPVFQIDPAGAKILDFDFYKQYVPKFSATDVANGGEGKFRQRLTDLIDFPEFFDNYPQLKKFSVVFDPSITAQGQMDINGKAVTLSVDYVKDVTEQELKETLLHELQHGIQAAERTPGGAAPSYFFGKNFEFNTTTSKWERTGPYVTGVGDMKLEVQNYQMLEDDLRDSISNFNKTPGLTQAESDAQYAEIVRKRDVLEKEKNRLDDWAYRKYQENPGEVEARAASLWSQLTPEERLKTPPLEIYNKAARTSTANYARLGETAVYGSNYMPTARFPASQEEALARLDANAKVISPESVDQTRAALGSAPEKNPVFLPRETASDNLIDFYSPVKNTVDTMDFGKNGIPGSVIVKYLTEKAPNMNRAELTSYKLNLEPDTRYTKEDVQKLLPGTNYSVKELPLDSADHRRFSGMQVQQIKLDMSEPFVLTLQGDKKVPFFHFTENDLGHTRASFFADSDGKKKVLIHEFQMDILQNIPDKPMSTTIPVQNYLRDLEIDAGESLSYQGVPEDKILELFKAREKGTLTDKEVSEGLYSIFKVSPQGTNAPPEYTLSYLTQQKYLSNGMSEEDISDKFINVSIDLQNDMIKVAESRALPKKDEFPINSTTDAVKKLLLGIISKAQKEGATEIVMPPLSRIAIERVGDFPDLASAEKALRPTYVDSFDKAINLLNREFASGSNTIPISLLESTLDYRRTKSLKAKTEKVKVLDISNFPALGDKKLKFADGGLVGYAQGGTVEREQMDKLMQEGGIAGSDVTQEPVTGNEVPPGSLPSEVRDDIPTQLSEGEYVVPADVVRFFGVKYFEDLRMQAKQGLSQMQSDGRIGGAAVDSNGVPAGEDELTPEEEQMLNQALGQTGKPAGMAYGGMVMGMAEGGDTPAEPTWDRSTFKLSDYQETGLEVRQYYNPKTKETRMFQFINGVSLGTIPDGFVPYTQGIEGEQGTPGGGSTSDTVNTGNTGGGGSNNRGNDGGGGQNGGGGSGTTSTGINYTNWAEKNHDAITSDPYQFGIEALSDTTGKTLSKGAGVVGLLSGNPLISVAGLGVKAYNKIENIAEANAALQIMEAQGLSSSEQYKKLETAIGAAVSDLPLVQQGLVKAHVFGSGNNMSAAVLSMDTQTPEVATQPIQEPIKKDKTVTPSFTTNEPAPVGGGTTAAPKPTRSDTPVGGGMPAAPKPTRSDTPVGGGMPAAPKPTPSFTTNAPAPVGGNNTPKTTPTKTEDRRATGGLITRNTKTAPKTKGLAGKQ